MKQYSTPILIKDNEVEVIKQIEKKGQYNESYIQKLIYDTPQVLPISRIEPIYDNPISLCREMPLKTGFVDDIYVNEDGYITIAECKLWKNPQARREVVAQIVDYAQALSEMDYETFEKQILLARDGKEKSLFEIVNNEENTIDEKDFVDSVSRNLKAGRFLLLIFGDGIQENAENLIRFLNEYSRLSFTLSMVEINLYSTTNGVLAIPNVLLKTTEIKRVIYQTQNEITLTLEDEKPTSATETEFYNRLEKNLGRDKAYSIRNMISELSSKYNLVSVLGRGKHISLNLKSSDEYFNLASFQEKGDIEFYGVVYNAGRLEKPEIGVEYLDTIAAFTKAHVIKEKHEWNWKIKHDNKNIEAMELVEHKEKWEQAIDKLLSAYDKLK